VTEQRLKKNLVWQKSQVSTADRHKLYQQMPATIWMTGLSGSGKSTLAVALEARLIASQHACIVLDGDNIRHGLCSDLGFSDSERKENIRRVAEVARLMNDAGLIVITAFISPFDDDRRMAADIIGADRFREVHLSTVLDICEERDPKGFYFRARRGEIKDFTGVSSPYEAPETPSLRLDTGSLSIDNCVGKLMECIAKFLQPLTSVKKS
jgi:adenylyl-sulfate kinase